MLAPLAPGCRRQRTRRQGVSARTVARATDECGGGEWPPLGIRGVALFDARRERGRGRGGGWISRPEVSRHRSRHCRHRLHERLRQLRRRSACLLAFRLSFGGGVGGGDRRRRVGQRGAVVCGGAGGSGVGAGGDVGVC